MDNQRLLVWAAFGMLAFMTYQAWLQDYGPQPAAPVAVTEESPPASDVLPGLPAADEDTPVLRPAASISADSAVSTGGGQIIRVSTDVFEVEINTAGGREKNTVVLRSRQNLVDEQIVYFKA